MNIRRAFNESLSTVKSVEGRASDKIKAGSKEPKDYMDMMYYNGVLNAFKFIDTMMDESLTELFVAGVTEPEWEELFNQMMRVSK